MNKNVLLIQQYSIYQHNPTELQEKEALTGKLAVH